TAKLFDTVALDRMQDAERAVRDAATHIPPDVRARFDTAKKLSDADRTLIIGMARTALASFQVDAP
ncbi:MAG: F0F1 ATP synthase subunit alpha, partial [Rhodoferax sp.]